MALMTQRRTNVFVVNPGQTRTVDLGGRRSGTVNVDNKFSLDFDLDLELTDDKVTHTMHKNHYEITIRLTGRGNEVRISWLDMLG